ncbi:putative phosphoenolpyruvate carboxylase [Arabidopsis thaliana]
MVTWKVRSHRSLPIGDELFTQGLQFRAKSINQTMAARNLEKMASIDAQLRLLAPGKVSKDDKLIEYDALLLDRFLDIL